MVSAVGPAEPSCGPATAAGPAAIAGPGRGPAPEPDLTALARAWADVLPGPVAEPVPGRLATLLLRLGAALRSQPFWPLLARRVGAELVESAVSPHPPDEQVLVDSLRLVREHAAVLFGPDPVDPDRLAATLDELSAGFAAALRDRTCWEQETLLQATLDARRGTERALAASEAHYRTIYMCGPVGIGIGGLDGLVLDVNPALSRMFGIRSPLGRPRPISDFVHPDDAVEFIAQYGRLAAGKEDSARSDVRFVRLDGTIVRTHLTASLVREPDGRPSHVIAVLEDVSERHRLRSRLEHVGSHDRLTRLPNRTALMRALRAAGEGPPHRVGVCAVDLDRFKDVNDSQGHPAGDHLLVAVAGRVQMAVADRLVARTGGNEFVVLVDDPPDGPGAARLADRVLAALVAPFDIAGRRLTVSASIGVVEARSDEMGAEELMRAAGVAQSWAKARGGGRRTVFDAARDAGDAERHALLASLPAAVANDQFRLVYQPLVRLVDRGVRAAEALVRWEHPEHGLMAPARFIGLAEQSGAIIALGERVLASACRQAREWQCRFGAVAPHVSVNVSPRQLVEPGWVRGVTETLAATGLAPDRLQLEITEQSVLDDEKVALSALHALRDHGVRLALDDFGTGYSSLSWLRRLPVHALKIDGSFVGGLKHAEVDQVDRSIVRALVGMAHGLGLEVTAEWVETGVQAERLAALGCDLGQGHLFGDAGPAAGVEALVGR